MCVMNHRAAVLASPASRTQIGFFQQVLLRRGDDETWFRTASAMFYQHQWELLTGLLAPYAGGVPMRAGPPFCAADTPHAPFVLLVPRFASVLCDIVERRYVTASTSNACTTCGEVVSMRAARDDPGIGDDEMDAVEHWFRGEVRSLCAPLSLLLRMMLARLLRPSRTWNVAVCTVSGGRMKNKSGATATHQRDGSCSQSVRCPIASAALYRQQAQVLRSALRTSIDKLATCRLYGARSSRRRSLPTPQ
jgi:hypothetical protein